MKSLFSTAILSLCSGLSVFLFTHFIPQQNELLLSPFFFFHLQPSSAPLLQADIKNTVRYNVKWLQNTCSSCEKATHTHKGKFPGPPVLHSQPFSNSLSHQQTNRGTCFLLERTGQEIEMFRRSSNREKELLQLSILTAQSSIEITFKINEDYR